MAEPIGALRAVLSATSAAFEKDMGRARKAVRREGSLMQRTFSGLKDSTSRFTRSIFNLRNAAAAAAGAAGLGLLVKRAVEGADKIAKTSDKLGVNVEALQELRFAAERAGVQQNTLDMALQRFTRRAAEAANGTGEAKDALAQLGIQLRDSEGRIRPTEELIRDVADAFSRVHDPAERLRLAFKLFDSEGVAMVNMLNDGRRGLDEMAETARRLGLVLSEELIRKAETAADQWGDMSQVMGVGMQRALLSFMPLIGEFSRIITDPEFVEAMDGFGQNMASGLQKAMPYIRAVLGGVASAVDTFTSLPGWLQTSGIMGAILFGKIRVLMIGAVLVNEVIKKVTDGVDLLKRAGELADDIAAELGVDTRGDRLRVDTSGLRSAASNMSALGDELATFAPATAQATHQVAAMTSGLADQNEQLERLIASYRQETEAIEATREDIELINQAKQQDIDLSTQQGQAWLEAAKRNRQLSAALGAVEQLYSQTRTGAELYASELEMLNSLLAEGMISQDLYNRALDQARERFEAVDPAAQAAKDAADLFAQTSFTALSDMIQRGDDAIDVIGRLASTIADAALQAALLGQGPLAGMFGTAGSGGALGGIFGSLFDALPGFRRGGSFEVRGIGGPDSQVTAMRTTPGEIVHVERKEDRRGSGRDDGDTPLSVGPVIIQTPDPESFRRSRGQVAVDLSRAVDAARRFR